jgi:autophagy-related protein 101
VRQEQSAIVDVCLSSGHSGREKRPKQYLTPTSTSPLGVLHTIFFHRYFPPIRPSLYTPTAASLSTHGHTHTSTTSQHSLPITLPSILDPPEISTAIDTHTNALISQLTPQQSSTSPTSIPTAAGGSRGEIVVRFYDRKRKKTGITTGWLGRLGGVAQTEEEVCWEEWCVQVIVARPRSEAGNISPFSVPLAEYRSPRLDVLFRP